MKVRTLLLISVILFIVMNSCSSAKKAGSGVSDTDRSHNRTPSTGNESIPDCGPVPIAKEYKR